MTCHSCCRRCSGAGNAHGFRTAELPGRLAGGRRDHIALHNGRRRHRADIRLRAVLYSRRQAGFQSVPTGLEEISQTLGMSPWRTFWRLTLPLAWPSVIGAWRFHGRGPLSEFGATIMFAGNFIGRTQTMPLAILSAMESDVGAALALAVMLLAASILVLLVLTVVASRASLPAGRLQ